jgi:hypothetical protein
MVEVKSVDKLTVVQLRKLAKSQGRKGYSTLRKKQLQKLVQSAPPAKKPSGKGILREIAIPEMDAALFLTKHPGSMTYDEMYVYGPKAIAYTRKSLKEKLRGYKYIKTPRSFLDKHEMTHLVNRTAAAGIGQFHDKRPRKQSEFPMQYGMFF